jgi:hypothetical protein
MRRSFLLLIAAILALPGCFDDDSDVTPPAPPRGFYSVTGDHEVHLYWLDNTEADVAGYRIYDSSCEKGPDCPYHLVAVTGATSYVVTGLTNGVTRYYAVTAFDHDGNESELSYDTVFDTPRPEGFDATLNNYVDSVNGSGWDFSAFTPRAWNHDATDMYFGYNGTIYQMFVPDFMTDIQDAGVASSLDAVDWAPSDGWSPTGTVELIEGHCYVVWTRDDNYAKFRVTDIIPGTTSTPARVVFDWAYQVDTGNRELRARPTHGEEGSGRRPVYWAR